MNNIQIKSEKFKLAKLIEEEEMRKANLLLQMGELTYQKIREKTIVDSSFEELCNYIMEADSNIYENRLKIEEFSNVNSKEVCECGEICKSGSKFCPSCGNELNINKYNNIVCSFCHKEIESDSKFCICCGKKVDSTYDDYQINECVIGDNDDEPYID